MEELLNFGPGGTAKLMSLTHLEISARQLDLASFYKHMDSLAEDGPVL